MDTTPATPSDPVPAPTPPRGFGQCYLRGRRWWIRYSHRGQDYRESSKSTRLIDAERLLKRRWKQIGAKQFIGPDEDRVTVGALLDALQLDYANNGRRSSLSYVMGPLRAYFGTARVRRRARLRDRSVQSHAAGHADPPKGLRAARLAQSRVGRAQAGVQARDHTGADRLGSRDFAARGAQRAARLRGAGHLRGDRRPPPRPPR
jgi:hypothetical protein